MYNANRATNGGFNYAPATEENGPLARYSVGEKVEKIVRPMSCIYHGDNGFYIYEVEENDRWFVIKGSFPYELILNSYYAITGTICLEKKRNTKQINVTSCESALPVNKEGVITVLKSLHE